MLGERQEGTSGWASGGKMGLTLLQPTGNIVIFSQPHEEAGVFLLNGDFSRNRVGRESLNPTLSCVGRVKLPKVKEGASAECRTVCWEKG